MKANHNIGRIVALLENDEAYHLLRPGDLLISDKGEVVRSQCTYMDQEIIEQFIDSLQVKRPNRVFTFFQFPNMMNPVLLT